MAGTRHRHSKGGDDALTAEMLLMADGDDALLDSLVKTATQAPQSRAAPRDRKRSRHADRKSCKENQSSLHSFFFCFVKKKS